MLPSVPDESEVSSHEDEPISPRVLKILELSARNTAPVEEVKPTRAKVPQADIFFWQCTSCSKFNQVDGNDMNHLLESTTSSQMQRVDSVSSFGGTRMPQVFVYFLVVELPQRNLLKGLTLHSCMRTSRHMSRIHTLRSKNLVKCAYTYIYCEFICICTARMYSCRFPRTLSLACHAPFVIKSLVSLVIVSTISSPTK